MRILLAGASGVIGTPLVMRLHAAGHDVLALHRAPEGAARMRAMGATPIRVDVLDRRALLQALDGVAVDAVISELTALKKPPITHGRMKVTDRLRTEGTANLLAAARATGAHRFLTQSMIFGYGYGDSGERGDQFLTERDPFGMGGRGRFAKHLSAFRINEATVFSADGIDGIALRYGLFYGGGATGAAMIESLRRRRIPVVDGGPLPWILVDDAADVTILALERGAGGAAYNVVDDEPASFATVMTAIAHAVGAPPPRRLPRWMFAALPHAKATLGGAMRVSNAKAKDELGWHLLAPTYRDGIALMTRTQRAA